MYVNVNANEIENENGKRMCVCVCLRQSVTIESCLICGRVQFKLKGRYTIKPLLRETQLQACYKYTYTHTYM